jgi:hypothetical protein
MNWFRRKRSKSAIEILSANEWMCTGCDLPHCGMFDLVAHAPDAWRGHMAYQANAELTLDHDFLSEDLCVIGGQHFFVRCVLEIPVHGMAEKFGFGCWSSLSRSNFELYVDGFDNGEYQNMGPWTSWLSNQLFDYIGAEPEGCWLHLQLDRQRPVLMIADENHPLGVDQRYGVPPDKILEIYRHYGHEVRL